MAARSQTRPEHRVVTFADAIVAGAENLPSAGRRNDPIEIEPCDSAWPARFATLAARLADALGPTAITIEHVGSTAVAGLAAKPVIDVQVSVPDTDDEDAYRPAIEALGFALQMREPGHRYFRPPPDLPRHAQIHVCGAGSPWERDHLLFRDYLRANAAVARAYADLKQRVAADHRDERIAYNDAKGPFIVEHLNRAEEWAITTGWPDAPAGHVLR